jgi:hypothetical protein
VLRRELGEAKNRANIANRKLGDALRELGRVGQRQRAGEGLLLRQYELTEAQGRERAARLAVQERAEAREIARMAGYGYDSE